MKILYLDCGMGAAGDMLTAALLDLLPEKEKFIDECNALGIPGVTYEALPSQKCGVTGLSVRVSVNGLEEASLMQEHSHHDHEHHDHGHEEHDQNHDHDHGHDHHHDETHPHHHSGMHDIEQVVQALPLSDKVKADVLAVYGLIAEAESHVHGQPVPEIHFHEVGTMDAVADVTAVCLLMDRLSPDEVIVSPVHVGSGFVECAHGTLPVPAPATAYLLRDVPIYGGEMKGELCTPTGAALLKYFATDFGSMPPMKITVIGYGMGKKDFEAANCVRAMLGESADNTVRTESFSCASEAETESGTDTVIELCCNLDDMSGEAIGFAEERLFAAGALDVFTIPIQMKKSRPGTLLCVLARPADRDTCVRLLFRHTTTLGVREAVNHRYTLERSVKTVETSLGAVQKKTAAGYGVTREKYEYDDLARIAAKTGMSMEEVLKKLE